MKEKKCKNCGDNFTPRQPLQYVCGYPCAIEYAKKQREKKETKDWKKEKKERSEKLMTHKDWLNIAQKVFNTYIRQRDKGLPCISCGTNSGQFHAGHYRSVGSTPELRFNEDNVHGQCATCNNYLSGNLIEYRKNLIKKIGVERVEFLEIKQPPLKLSIDEIKNLITLYKSKIKELNE